MALSGCSLHRADPEVRPAVEDSGAFQAIEGTGASETAPGPWWQAFGSPQLDALIRQSLEQNQDIRQALERVNQARTRITQTQSGRYPRIDLQGSTGENLEGPDRGLGNSRIGGLMTWEVDAFNRLDAAAKADQFEAAALAEDVEALKLSLSADVAIAYFGAVAAHNTLDLLAQQVRIDQELLELLELRFESGVGTRVEVMQQQSRVAESQSLIPPAQADLRVYENRLDLLVGQVPDGKNRVPASLALDVGHPLPRVGVPADLLINRPDLRAARASLMAADHDIGAAIADRLPRITLTGSAAIADLPGHTGIVSAIAGSFVQPLLDWGRRKAEVQRNQSLYQERLAAFTQAYIAAVESVENALYQENRQREYIKRLENRRALLSDTLGETEARYARGVDTYLPVLNALQELREVERDLVGQRLVLAQFRISLHRAAGGSLGSEETEL